MRGLQVQKFDLEGIEHKRFIGSAPVEGTASLTTLSVYITSDICFIGSAPVEGTASISLLVGSLCDISVSLGAPRLRGLQVQKFDLEGIKHKLFHWERPG